MCTSILSHFSIELRFFQNIINKMSTMLTPTTPEQHTTIYWIQIKFYVRQTGKTVLIITMYTAVGVSVAYTRSFQAPVNRWTVNGERKSNVVELIYGTTRTTSFVSLASSTKPPLETLITFSQSLWAIKYIHIHSTYVVGKCFYCYFSEFVVFVYTRRFRLDTKSSDYPRHARRSRLRNRLLYLTVKKKIFREVQTVHKTNSRNIPKENPKPSCVHA